nr:helix-turn-helix domain-containing protein [Candidatus Woesearchaeota archaeon]
MGITKKRRRRLNSRRVGRKRFPGKQELELERSIKKARQIKEGLAYSTTEKPEFPFEEVLQTQEQPSQENQYEDYERTRHELLRIYNTYKGELSGKSFSIDFLVSQNYTDLANAIKEFHGNKILVSLILPKTDKTGRTNPFYNVERDNEEDRENFLLAHGIKPGVGKITEDHFKKYKKPSIKTLESRLGFIREVGLHPADRPWILLESPSTIKRAAEASKRVNDSSPYHKLGVNSGASKENILEAIIEICAEVSEKYYTKEHLQGFGYKFVDKGGKERYFVVPTKDQLKSSSKESLNLYLWKHYGGVPKFREYVHEHFKTERKEQPNVPPTWEVRRNGKIELLVNNGITEDNVSKKLWSDLNRHSLKKLEESVGLIKEFGFDVDKKIWLIPEGDITHLRERLEDMKYDLFIRNLLRNEYDIEIDPKATFVKPITLRIAKANRDFQKEEIDESLVERAFVQGISGNEDFRHVLLAAKRNNQKAIETLLKHYESKIKNLTFNHYRDAPIEDKNSFARIGLFGAIKHFTNPGFDLDDFGAYCYRCMQYEISQHYKDVNLVSLQKVVHTYKDGNKTLLEDTIASYDRFDERLIERDLIEYVSSRLKENLTKPEYNLLVDNYGLEGKESLSPEEMKIKYGYKNKAELEKNLQGIIQKAQKMLIEGI